MTAFPLRLPFTKKTADNRADVSSIAKKETIVKTEVQPKTVKLTKKQFKVLQWLKKHFVNRFIPTEKVCLSCKGTLPQMSLGTVRRWCSKRCHWARHNTKYYYTERGHKKGWHGKGSVA